MLCLWFRGVDFDIDEDNKVRPAREGRSEIKVCIQGDCSSM